MFNQLFHSITYKEYDMRINSTGLITLEVINDNIHIMRHAFTILINFYSVHGKIRKVLNGEMHCLMLTNDN